MAAGDAEALTAVEFYSGLGGWTMALEGCGRRVDVLAAYDHSTVCNDVYAANHCVGQPRARFAKPSQRPIEKLSAVDLDALAADVWAMSPPCQPHTRQREGLAEQRRDADDPRAASFLHLCALLGQMVAPPSTIVLENVVGFESSHCCALWLKALYGCGFTDVQQYHLTPTQFGFPNERPRYYGVARRRGRGESQSGSALPVLDVATALPRPPSTSADAAAGTAGSVVGDHLELPRSWRPSEVCSQGAPDAAADGSGGGRATAGEVLPDWLQPWAVPSETMSKDAAWCFDIVEGSHARTSCFTRSYSRFVRGTGSILFVPKTSGASSTDGAAEAATDVNGDAQDAVAVGNCRVGPDALRAPELRSFGDDWKARVHAGGVLRYFTPREVANLLGFPKRFSFQPTLKPKKAFELLGNSLHVGVASLVLAHALDGSSEITERARGGRIERGLEAPRAAEAEVVRGDHREAKRARRMMDEGGMT